MLVSFTSAFLNKTIHINTAKLHQGYFKFHVCNKLVILVIFVPYQSFKLTNIFNIALPLKTNIKKPMNFYPIPSLSHINPLEVLIFLSKINCLLKHHMTMNNLMHNDMAGKTSIYFTNMAGKTNIYFTNKQTVIYMKTTI